MCLYLMVAWVGGAHTCHSECPRSEDCFVKLVLSSRISMGYRDWIREVRLVQRVLSR